jgi:molybdopterin synthase catalytic subunit
MPQDSISNQFFNGFANAVDDIRHRVVEEPFWGREVTDSGPAPRWPEAKEVEPAQQQREQEAPEPDIDMER